MAIVIEDVVKSLYLNVNQSTVSSTGVFKIKPAPGSIYLEELYANPSKRIKLKWETLDDLNDGSSSKKKLSFGDRTELFFSTENKNSSLGSSDAPWDSMWVPQTKSSKQFFDKTKNNIQKALKTVPVFTVLNGHNNIVTIRSSLREENNWQLGLFFMTYEDAEEYLFALIESRPDRARKLGYSVHCFGLDAAYRVMRENHPGIDFRLIPDLTEVQTLLADKRPANSLTMFEKGQKQLRAHHRKVDIPWFTDDIMSFDNIDGVVKDIIDFEGEERTVLTDPAPKFWITIGKWFSPFHSFLQQNEYFKGVPVYIVKVNEVPYTSSASNSFKLRNVVDKVIGGVFHVVDFTLGRGDAWILQGSLESTRTSPEEKTYVFFEREMALKFCQEQEQRITRFNATRSSLVHGGLFFRKPKVCIFNLEDLLERWEDALVKPLDSTSTASVEQNSMFQDNFITFVPARKTALEVSEWEDDCKKNPLYKTIEKVNEWYWKAGVRTTAFLDYFFEIN